MCIMPPLMKHHISGTIKKKSMCIDIALLVVVRLQKKTNIGGAHGTPPVG